MENASGDNEFNNIAFLTLGMKDQSKIFWVFRVIQFELLGNLIRFFRRRKVLRTEFVEMANRRSLNVKCWERCCTPNVVFQTFKERKSV